MSGLNSPIWVIGSANMDLVFRCHRFPSPGETLMGTGFAEHPGGKGANQAVAIGKLGHPVSFVGCVGNDNFGGKLIRKMRESGVTATTLSIHESMPTGTAMILVDDSGQNQIVVIAGANSAVTREIVRETIDAGSDSLLVAQLEIPLEAVLEASKLGRLILNPAPARELPDELYSNLFATVPNEREAEFLTGISPDSEASQASVAEWFHAKGVQNVVLTLGEKGCYYSGTTAQFGVSAFAVEAVDTTAAGDAFIGGLAFSLSEGTEWREALEFASAVAAISVTKAGALESLPTLEEVQAFLASQ